MAGTHLRQKADAMRRSRLHTKRATSSADWIGARHSRRGGRYTKLASSCGAQVIRHTGSSSAIAFTVCRSRTRQMGRRFRIESEWSPVWSSAGEGAELKTDGGNEMDDVPVIRHTGSSRALTDTACRSDSDVSVIDQETQFE